MVYSFARVGAALGMTVADVYTQQRRLWVKVCRGLQPACRPSPDRLIG
jgi:hypothetical protein